MDPVNRWITTIIAFMLALLLVIGFKAGSGRYAMQVVSTKVIDEDAEGYGVPAAQIFVLDTREGVVFYRTIVGTTIDHSRQRFKKLDAIESRHPY